MARILLMCTFLFYLSCKQFEANRANEYLLPLEGLWCIEVDGKQLCEEWVYIEDGSYYGKGFEVDQSDTLQLEELRISTNGNELVYSALVFSQNNARWIDFKLRTTVNRAMIFENKEHDFPNQIRLYFPNEEIMQVQVLGNDGNGFTHQFNKIM